MSEIFQVILGSSLVTTFTTSVIAYFFHKRTERTNAIIKREFEILAQKQNTDFESKKQTTQLLGQVYIYLNRTRKAYENKYSKLTKYDPYFEDEIVFASNKRLRDLILDNGHHIPPDLLEDASKIVEHFDVWFTKYNTLRKVEKDIITIHVYVGPDGFRFPIKAEERFKESYIKLYNFIASPYSHNMLE
jgi:hypothetical protein